MEKAKKVNEFIQAFINGETVEFFSSGEWWKVNNVNTILEYFLYDWPIRIKRA